MKNEMEQMKMDERQRLAWFMANRGTLIAVGTVWIGMIAWELAHGRAPAFLMIMVPVFALFRAGLYFFYNSRPFVSGDSVRGRGFAYYGKIAAALILLGSIFLHLYSVPGELGEERQYRHVWYIVKEEILLLIPLMIMYLWPFLILGLERLQSRRRLQIFIQFAEPVLAVFSVINLLWIPQLLFEGRVFFLFLIGLVDPKPELGCYVAVGANALYMISWLAGFLRPWGVQEG